MVLAVVTMIYTYVTEKIDTSELLRHLSCDRPLFGKGIATHCEPLTATIQLLFVAAEI